MYLLARVATTKQHRMTYTKEEFFFFLSVLDLEARSSKSDTGKFGFW